MSDRLHIALGLLNVALVLQVSVSLALRNPDKRTRLKNGHVLEESATTGWRHAVRTLT